MEFTNPTPIYIQIAHLILERVINKQLIPSERIESVREMASNIDVNPNTVARTYSFLSDLDIINNTRGVGYFLTEHAEQKALDYLRNNLIKSELPDLFNSMNLLGITPKEFTNLFLNYNKNEKK